MRKILLALTVLSPLSAFADAGNSLSIPAYWYGVPLIAVVALAMAFFFYKAMMKADPGSSRMQEIAQYVREGAYAYLHRQYRTVTDVFAAIFVIFVILAFLGIQNPFVPSDGSFSSEEIISTALQLSAKHIQTFSYGRLLRISARKGALNPISMSAPSYWQLRFSYAEIANEVSSAEMIIFPAEIFRMIWLVD